MATTTLTSLETYFQQFRENVIGINQTFQSNFGEQKIVYADWTASGRLYQPIEDRMSKSIAPFVGNTHTETSVTGASMTVAYHKALNIIKKHVSAAESDVIISCSSGMTGVINKFQRILGLKIHERFANSIKIPKEKCPIVFVTHMEHHSNQTSWLETIADVEIIKCCPKGLVDLNHLKELLEQYKDRPTKIAAITSCSNVTGIKTPYHEIAEIMHQNNGLCFVDFACSAPYIDIDMHPENPLQCLDAIFFSPHKFLGGPGTTGILIFDSKLYKNKIPDHPGGGTVSWTDPWGSRIYFDNIEAREDGGTPAFLQTMRVALCIKLKEEMQVSKILAREAELVDLIWDEFEKIPNLHILAPNIKERLGVISFYIDGLHYNLAVRLLNDRYGIQVRGGCSCAGTYGHYLLDVSLECSTNVKNQIQNGSYFGKSGWVRLSIHPVMTNEETSYIIDAIKELAENHSEWSKEYTYTPSTNEFVYANDKSLEETLVNDWFNQSLA